MYRGEQMSVATRAMKLRGEKAMECLQKATNVPVKVSNVWKSCVPEFVFPLRENLSVD
jgi:hypothetical protein